jgi:hypothetical protein
MDENVHMTSTALTNKPRPGGLWDALAIATRDDDPSESRRRLAALRLRHATASVTDYDPCA